MHSYFEAVTVHFFYHDSILVIVDYCYHLQSRLKREKVCVCIKCGITKRLPLCFSLFSMAAEISGCGQLCWVCHIIAVF